MDGVVTRVLLATVIVAVLSSCAPSSSLSSGPKRDSAYLGANSCSSLLTSVLSRERTGDTSGAINAELDNLAQRCPDRYQVFVDYMSIKGMGAVGAGGSCSEYSSYGVQPQAIKLARKDGHCTGSAKDDAGFGIWTCQYAPTFNDDWHDDVVCSNGVDQERPYLREWDNFVTQTEIMKSAREYEQQLNAR